MMPEILAALAAARTPVSVLTKSPLVMRDVEHLRADGEAAAGLGQPLGADPRRGRLAGDRAAHAEPRGPPRRGRRAAPPRDRVRRPDRAADAGHQRRPRAGASRSSSAPARPAPPSSAASPSTSATRSRTSSSPGWRPNAPTCSPATKPSTATAPTCAPRTASTPPEPSAAGAANAPHARSRRRARAPDQKLTQDGWPGRSRRRRRCGRGRWVTRRTLREREPRPQERPPEAGPAAPEPLF